MIANPFDYSPVASLTEALELIANGGKPLAGGMSLVPMMKLRLAAPDHLVDIARVAELRAIREEGEFVRVGATATHYEVESSAVLRRSCPLLPKTASNIGDAQVRNLGTIGGSLAHADPAADYPAALAALEAQVHLASSSGRRTVPISEFLIDSFTTSLEPGEIITGFSLPIDGPDTGTAYVKMAQAASGYAMVGVAVRVRRSGGKISLARIGITGTAPIAYRAEAVERALEGTAGSDIHVAKAASLATEGVEVIADMHADAAYRSRLATVQTARAIRTALAELI